jgi:hypothetical protein
LVAGAALEAAINVAMNDDNNHLVNDPGKTHPLSWKADLDETPVPCQRASTTGQRHQAGGLL